MTLPMPPWQIRLSLWLAYVKDPTVEAPTDVLCQIWGCREWGITLTWPPRLVRQARRMCPHRGDGNE